MEETIRFSLNGKKTELKTDPSQTLVWVLRNQLGLTGTKWGCGTGFCGACTVLIDDEPVRSCQVPVSDVAGKKVVTIEGLERKGRLHPVQKAFVEHDAFQCGFCTSGMILATIAFLKKNKAPTREQIIEALDDNLCRCTAHVRIVEAVLAASKEMKGGK